MVAAPGPRRGLLAVSDLQNVSRHYEASRAQLDAMLRSKRLQAPEIAALLGIGVARVLLTLAFDLLLASLVVPFILGLYWSRGGAAAAWAAIVVGIGVRMTFFMLTPTIYGVDNTLFYIPNDLVTVTADGWSTLLAGAASLAAYLVAASFTTVRTTVNTLPTEPAPAPEVLTAARS